MDRPPQKRDPALHAIRSTRTMWRMPAQHRRSLAVGRVLLRPGLLQAPSAHFLHPVRARTRTPASCELARHDLHHLRIPSFRRSPDRQPPTRRMLESRPSQAGLKSGAIEKPGHAGRGILPFHRNPVGSSVPRDRNGRYLSQETASRTSVVRQSSHRSLLGLVLPCEAPWSYLVRPEHIVYDLFHCSSQRWLGTATNRTYPPPAQLRQGSRVPFGRSGGLL